MAFGRKRTKLNSLHYFERKALLYQFFCHHVKDAQSIDKFCWVSKWHRTNNGRTIFFWTGVGGGWKILTCKHFFFISGWLLQTIFCVSPSSCKNFFLIDAIYFSVYRLCKQFISKFSNPPPPPPSRPRQKIMVRPAWQRRKKNYCAK